MVGMPAVPTYTLSRYQYIGGMTNQFQLQETYTGSG